MEGYRTKLHNIIPIRRYIGNKLYNVRLCIRRWSFNRTLCITCRWMLVETTVEIENKILKLLVLSIKVPTVIVYFIIFLTKPYTNLQTKDTFKELHHIRKFNRITKCMHEAWKRCELWIRKNHWSMLLIKS